MKRSVFTTIVFISIVLYSVNINSQELPSRFYGKYGSNICDECHWTFNEDGTGLWSIGLYSGTEQVSFIWEVMIDKNGDLQLATQGDQTGYAFKITYMTVRLSDNVKSTLTSSQRDNPQAMGIFWFNDQDISFQFLAKTNGFYKKI